MNVKYSAKVVLDSLFEKFKFDTALYKKIVRNNVEFITRDEEHKNLFGSRLIGSQLIKYTFRDKNIFYDNIFGMESTDAVGAIDKITTINKSFKIARDDINLVCFYIAHRFLSNQDLSESKRLEYAQEILNYFSYRTLVLISSNYFVYPISEEKAITLIEKLSNKYTIKKVKNWNEYCQYRSEEYLKSKYLSFLVKFTDDVALPNAITDLFGRTKDTLKNIYSDFIDMMENDDIITSKKNIMSDVDGKEVIMDRLGTPESYYIKLEGIVTDKSVFIKRDYIDVSISIIESVSYTEIEKTLEMTLDYLNKSKSNYDTVMGYFKDVLSNSITYLHDNKIFIHKNTSVLKMINTLVGNILYARGTDISINEIKENGDKLVKTIYKSNKEPIADRHVRNIRNVLYVYILLKVLVL